MTSDRRLGGSFTFGATGPEVHRMGYGAMQLAGPGVFGPPRDRAEAVAVLREAVEAGVDHIDTSDFYGPHVTNEVIREALHPYPRDLVIVTKVGAKRTDDKGWHPAISDAELTAAVHDNLRNLGLEQLAVVNLRLLTPDTDVERQLSVLAALQEQGLIAHLGLSEVTPEQYEAVKRIAPIVCVQNMYNIAHRKDDAFIDQLAGEGVAYVPWYPLGGYNQVQTERLNTVAARVGASPLQVALGWLLNRSPNILLIPGTSSRAHLRENLAAVDVELSPDDLAALDGIHTDAGWRPAFG